mgnify:CR=1 FL=1
MTSIKSIILAAIAITAPVTLASSASAQGYPQFGYRAPYNWRVPMPGNYWRPQYPGRYPYGYNRNPYTGCPNGIPVIGSRVRDCQIYRR